jgi:hypothetical protein
MLAARRSKEGQMPRVSFEIVSSLEPDAIHGALTDFSDRRPDLWPAIKHEEYEVYEIGHTTALVREGSGGSIWAKERYDWSRPGVVRWEVVESGFCERGSYVQAEIRSRAEGGSLVQMTWDRRPSTLGARLMLGLVALTRGAPVKSSFRKGLARIAAHPVG